MINQNYTRLFLSDVKDVADGVLFQEEGIAAVYVNQNGVSVIAPATGVAGEVFAGIVQSRNTPPAFGSDSRQVVPVDGKIVLPRTPIATEIGVFADGEQLDVVADAPDEGEIQLVGSVLTTHSTNATSVVTVNYHYELTSTEARTLVGDAPVGGLSSTHQKRIGVITRGQVATNYFDATADWTGAIQLKLAAGGYFTPAADDSEAIPGVVLVRGPSADAAVIVVDIK